MSDDSFFRRGLNFLAYVCLLIVSYALVYGIYQEYISAKTDFVESKESVTVQDNPAILVKFVNPPPGVASYGTDYTIEVSDWVVGTKGEENQYSKVRYLTTYSFKTDWEFFKIN